MATHRVPRRAISSFARVVGLLIALLVGPAAAVAAPAARSEPDAKDAKDATESDEAPTIVAPDSPRAAVSTFLELCDRGRYDDAARFLELPRSSAEDGPELARRLDAVLDRRVVLDLDSISPLSTGNPDDGLPRGVDEIAVIELEDEGGTQPVRLKRKRKPAASWMFQRATVEHIDDWYIGLEDRWLLETLPGPLLRMGPRGLLWWQWIALPIVLVGSWVAGWAMSKVTRRLASKPLARTQSVFDDRALLRLSGPITLFWALVLSWFGIQFLHLLPRAEDFAERVILAGYLLALFWALFRLTDVVLQLVSSSPWGRTHATGRALLPLAGRVAKVTLAAIGIVALLAQLGYPIASLIAGLGIGGLALALAAQKTVENLFGTFSIGADQPFREGDTVRIENFIATVEFIGLRSTRFRTPDRTIITIPNGKLAEMRLESLAVRDRLRFTCILGLVMDASEAQIRSVIERCETVLKGHPKIASDAPTVRFIAIGPSSFDLEVNAYFETSDWSEFVSVRQEVLLELVKAIESAGTKLAYPTQTVFVDPQGGITRRPA